jgi:hypothetical protein
MGTVPDCFHLKVKKIIYMLTLLPKGIKKIFNNFLIDDFFHAPPVSPTLVVHFELRISPRNFEKI